MRVGGEPNQSTAEICQSSRDDSLSLGLLVFRLGLRQGAHDRWKAHVARVQWWTPKEDCPKRAARFSPEKERY
eukprot:4349669-Amphidinium_carterae.1